MEVISPILKQVQRVTILGATGSIGQSTLSVLTLQAELFEVFAVTANTNTAEMLRICLAHKPRYAVMVNQSAAATLGNQLRELGSETEVLQGDAALAEVASSADIDVVVAAIVGAAGLMPSLAAVKAGKRVLLANKEALVMTGQLFMDEVKKSGATLLPVDSEHNAIYQCLPLDSQKQNGLSLRGAGIEKLILTASGGPFLNCDIATLNSVTPEQACAHPNWDMGKKISVDSATMMNKGLEVIEASWLFSAEVEQIDVVIHPESIVHSMVQYCDGSVLAQMGNPDMRTPIAYSLSWPHRMTSGVSALDLVKAGSLHFTEPDYKRFPCLQLAFDALKEGGTAPAILNAANEVAVDAFLSGGIPFASIASVIDESLQRMPSIQAVDVDAVLRADQEAREVAVGLLSESVYATSIGDKVQ